jgi:hypothetical protein
MPGSKGSLVLILAASNALITLQNPLWNKLAADDGGLRVFDVTNSYLPPQS